MSIVDIKRNAVPVELRFKIERVMRDNNFSWRKALVFLAEKVVSPARATTKQRVSFCQ